MRTLFFVLAGLGLLACVVGCGSDDDGGTGPGNNSNQNSAATGFDALATAHAAVVGAHAETYSSLATFGPAIGAHLASAKMQEAGGDVARKVCSLQNLADIVFAYDTELQQYVATDTPGAPAGGARYELYQVDEFGNPTIPLTVQGHLDLRCDEVNDDLVMNLTGGGVDVLGLAINVLSVNPPDYILTSSPGTFHDAQGNAAVGFLLTADGSVGQNMGIGFTIREGLDAYDSRAAGFQASAGLDDADLDASGAPTPPYFGFGVGAAQFDAMENPLWNASVGGSVLGDGTLLNILQGEVAPLEFEDRRLNTNGILACFSGNHQDPLVQNASASCATGVIQQPISLSAADLEAIQEGYVALIDLLESLSTGLAMVLPIIVR